MPLSLRHTLALLLLGAAASPSSAAALVEAPVTVDGPSADVRDVGGAALASDGTGGAVYTKVQDGVPHVFATRRLRGGWTAPIRVDALPYEAEQPRVAASDHGRLLVVWVSQIATVHKQVRRALYSAWLPAGGTAFGPPLLVDPNVRDGAGLEPSLAGTAPGRAIVAYRVTTDALGPLSTTIGAVTLRPGDVLAEVRLARFQGTRWSRLGAINRNADASMPTPAPGNAPRVAVADSGAAVVAWQERDQGAVARIWARRVFGTSLGPVLQASPSTWEGQPVTADADALALDVSPFGMAEVVARVPGTSDPALGGSRLFANQLPVSVDEGAGTFRGSVAVDGGPLPGAVGVPSVAVADGGRDGSTRIAFATDGTLRLPGLGAAGPLSDPQPAPPPSPAAAETAVALGDGGGHVAAWSTVGADGLPAVAVRQQLAGGAVQTGALAGAAAGEVSGLRLGHDVAGDAIIAFLQGSSSAHQVVVAGVTAPPAPFSASTPDGWVRPRAARVSWEPARSGTAGVSYRVLLDGAPIADGLSSRSLRPAEEVLGDGVRAVRVLATDAVGQETAADPVQLRVDARPPTARVARAPRRFGRRAVVVTVTDAESGVDTPRTTCRFGDGTEVATAHRTFRHAYRRPGRYVLRVSTRDRAGNATTRQLQVQVR